VAYAHGCRKCILTGLSLHRPHPRVLEKQPIVRLIPFACALRIADFVVFVVPGDEILHNRPRLEKVDLLSIGELVCQGWDTAVRVDFEEPVFLLHILGYVDSLGPVG